MELNPIHESKETDSQMNMESKTKTRKDILGQKGFPWKRKEHRLDPAFYKCQGKIVKYESKELNIWGVSFLLVFTSFFSESNRFPFSC
jgi:hypothetical protein